MSWPTNTRILFQGQLLKLEIPNMPPGRQSFTFAEMQKIDNKWIVVDKVSCIEHGEYVVLVHEIDSFRVMAYYNNKFYSILYDWLHSI